MKGESRKPSLLEFFAGLSPFLDPASQRGVTPSVIPHSMRYPGKARVGEPAEYISFTSLSGPRVAARGDVLVIPHPDAVSRKSLGGRARKIHSLLRPSLDPASQRGVTLSVIPHLMRNPPGMQYGGLSKEIACDNLSVFE